MTPLHYLGSGGLDKREDVTITDSMKAGVAKEKAGFQGCTLPINALHGSEADTLPTTDEGEVNGGNEGDS